MDGWMDVHARIYRVRSCWQDMSESNKRQKVRIEGETEASFMASGWY